LEHIRRIVRRQTPPVSVGSIPAVRGLIRATKPAVK
jgi:hypothetical protein